MRRSKGLFDRTERLPGVELPLVVFIHGCPDANRVLGINLTPRQAMLGSGTLVEALPTESIKAFHNRVCELARAEGPGMRVVSMSGEPPRPQPKALTPVGNPTESVGNPTPTRPAATLH